MGAQAMWRVVGACVGVVMGAVMGAVAAPLTDAFTYQGRLEQNGVGVNGVHDLRFALYDAASGGLPLGGVELCLNDVPVVDGRFSVQLDFGAAFEGSRRFLQVQARQDAVRECGDLAGFVTLGPRQELTVAPVARYAVEAGNAGTLGGLTPSFFTNASSLQSGTLADARLSANVARRDVGNTFSGTNVFSGFTGVGMSGPVTGADVFSIRGNDDGVVNLYSGMYAVSNFANGKPFYGMRAATGSYGWTYLNGADGMWRLSLGGLDVLGVTQAGSMGIGTVSPGARLDVRGDIRMGSTGSQFAASGDENLRMLRGRVGASGNVVVGSGFTAARLTPAYYRVTFSNAFSGIPTVTVSATGTLPRFVTVVGAGVTSMDIQTFTAAGASADGEFSFIVVGPK